MSTDPQNVDDVFKIYREYFLPIYADLVGYIGDKPKEVVFEMENILSHIAQAYNPGLEANLKESNLGKAYGHIVRATLDCYKLLWVEIHRDLEEFTKDHGHLFQINSNPEQFTALYKDFKMKASVARKKEIDEVGIDPLKSIELYRDVIEEGQKLLQLIDVTKVKEYKRSKFKYTFKKQGWSFVIGLVTGVFGNYIWNLVAPLIGFK